MESEEKKKPIEEKKKKIISLESERKKKLSHPDEDLESDYRPTRYGSTDHDRKETEKKSKSH
jgi:hypothetical protein